MKLIYAAFFISVIIFISCKKKPVEDFNKNIKIELMAGNNQADTIGRVLKDSLEFKVTRDGLPYPFPYIYISLPNCSGNISTSFWGGKDGVCQFSWPLNSTVGAQTIIIYVVDSLGNKLDSISANATGVSYDHGWMPGDCVSSSTGIYQLNGGRILNYANPGIYYSDNNGSSWNILSSFPDPKGQSYKFSIYGKNIFALNNFNLWYSPDNGASWQSFNNVKDSVGDNIGSLGITGSGKVFFRASSRLYMSTDFLKTWVPKSLPSDYRDFVELNSNVIEATNGTLFLIGNSGNMFQSTDLGTTWNGPFLDINSAFADESGDVYLGRFNNLYRLSNPGQPGSTLTLIKSFPSLGGESEEVKNITKVNGNYYFYVPQYGLMKTTDFVSFQNIYPHHVFSFCITKSNAAVVAGDGDYIFINRSYFPLEYNLNP